MRFNSFFLQHFLSVIFGSSKWSRECENTWKWSKYGQQWRQCYYLVCLSDILSSSPFVVFFLFIVRVRLVILPFTFNRRNTLLLDIDRISILLSMNHARDLPFIWLLSSKNRMQKKLHRHKKAAAASRKQTHGRNQCGISENTTENEQNDWIYDINPCV